MTHKIVELMGQIPDDLSAEVDTTCPFHGCLLEHRTSDNGFNYVKCPEYPCAFIASQQEVRTRGGELTATSACD